MGLLKTARTIGITASLLSFSIAGYLTRDAFVPPPVPASPITIIEPVASEHKTPNDTEDVLRQFEHRVADSVVCIRADAEYVQHQYSPLTEELNKIPDTSRTHGTGFVIAEVPGAQGTLEYRILTNHHVATNPRITVNGFGMTSALERLSLHIVDDGADQQASDDIALRIVAMNPNLDLAILETVGNKRKLKVADIAFGAPKQIGQNDMLITAGYPFANNKQTIQGKLSSTDYVDLALLPYPERVYSVDLRFDKGQSGSPVVVAFIDGQKQLRFYLAGLIYASAVESDTTRLITPMNEDARAFIAQQKEVESKRPSLLAPFGPTEWNELRKTIGDSEASYTAEGRTYSLIDGAQRPVLRRFNRYGDMRLDNAWLDIALSIEKNSVRIEDITATADGITTTLQIPQERKVYYGKVFHALLNGFRHQQEYRAAIQQQDATSEQTRMRTYLQRVVNDNERVLDVDLDAFEYDLRRTGKLPKALH